MLSKPLVNWSASSISPYTLTSALDGLQLESSEQGVAMDCLLPRLSLLVESEMHLLLRHAQVFSPAWGQHIAQLSELLRSPSYPDGPETLLSTVNARFLDFARWVMLYLKGEANYADLYGIRDKYINNKIVLVRKEYSFIIN